MALTNNTRDLVSLLLQGYYLRKRINHSGVCGFMLYQGAQIPVLFVHERTVKSIFPFLKEKRKVYTINLSLVRQAHGRTIVKQMYKKYRDEIKV